MQFCKQSQGHEDRCEVGMSIKDLQAALFLRIAVSSASFQALINWVDCSEFCGHGTEFSLGLQ